MKQWPYQCSYPSIVNQKGSYVFMYDIYKCCQRCEFPAYDSCIKKNRRSPSWRCPSDGIHCIVECIITYGPKKAHIIKKPHFSFRRSNRKGRRHTRRKVPKLKCERLERRPNGKTCIRRLCIKLIV